MPCCWGRRLTADQGEQGGEPWSPWAHHGLPGRAIQEAARFAQTAAGPSLVSPGAVGRGAREPSERVRCFRICRDAGFWNKLNSRESNLRVQWPLLCFCAGSHSARRALLAQKICSMPQRSQNSLLVEKTRSRRPLRSLQTHKSAGRTQRLNVALIHI